MHCVRLSVRQVRSPGLGFGIAEAGRKLRPGVLPGVATLRALDIDVAVGAFAPDTCVSYYCIT